MADSPSSPATIAPNLNQPDSDKPSHQPDTSATAAPPPPTSQDQRSAPANPNINQPPSSASLPPPSIQPYPPPPQPISVPPTAPSYRPVPIPGAPQFSPVQNYQNPAVQPPGVAVSGGVAVTMAPPMMPYPVVPGQVPNMAVRPYAPVPNGYSGLPAHAPGLPRYPAPYPTMVRPVFPPRPPGPVGVVPAVARPPVPGIPGVRPIVPPVLRPAVFPVVTPAEKPQTTVYIGKIAPSADNDFMLSILQVCGPVKSWKRAQDPSNGSLKGFGFCEFESAEGVLRALRLLSKFNIDGQELVLNVNQATREYLERYVEKRTENTKKLKETQDAGAEKENESAQVVEKNEPPKRSEDLKDTETENKENHDTANFGIVTDEDREADREASEKLTNMIEERLKANPLPPPPAQSAADGTGTSNAEFSAKSRDADSDGDVTRNGTADDKIDDETTSDTKATNEHDRPETSSPDRGRMYDRRSRDRDRERDLKREKEREIDRYEREAERERVRKEREQRRKIEDAEREYERCLKDWEYREREREKERQYEKEREKERERKRKKEILYDEEEDDDSRKRWRRSVLEDKRRKRLREKDEDLADKIKEEEELAEAKRRAEEEQQLQRQQKDALKLLFGREPNGTEKSVLAEEHDVENKDKRDEKHYLGNSLHENHIAGDEVSQNGIGDESTNASIATSEMRQGSNAPAGKLGNVSAATSDTRQGNNAPARKLGFGLVGFGKRTAVPSVFHEDEDDDAQKEKKMRPLVPVDYSTEELQAAQPIGSGANPPNLAAAAEFAKRISNVNPKEDKPDAERERSRRSHDRSGHREKDRGDEDNSRARDENKEKVLDRDRDREHGLDKVKTPDNKKLLDAKQLIDMIPKTKEELFSYEINWAVYDKHELHERMRPWISKKITEFLGEEETTLVDYIVSSTQEHVKASQMLELLQAILDDEAEMFVLKMWRMLIFEIKKVETGLALRSKA